MTAFVTLFFIIYKKTKIAYETLLVGLGPSGSNGGEVSGFSTTPTFVETLVAQNQISEPIFGIYIAPLGADSIPEGTGEITFGGFDMSKIQGD